MFKALGILLACYLAHAVFTGRVWAKAGAGSTTVFRQDRPGYFWMVIVVSAALSVALVAWF